MFSKATPAGLEPAIPGSVGRCLIHWANRPTADNSLLGISIIFGILVLQADIGVNVGSGVRAPARPLVVCFLAIAES